MPKHPFHDTFKNLLLVGQLTEALAVLKLGLKQIDTQLEWEEWGRLLDALMEREFSERSKFLYPYARVLHKTNRPNIIISISEGGFSHDDFGFSIELAWAFNQKNRSRQALAILEALPQQALDKTMAGGFWFTLAQVQFSLSHPWQMAIENAAILLTGQDLGILLTEKASYLFMSGDTKQARQVYAEAVTLLAGDVYRLAWLYYNWGMLELRIGSIEAESRLLESVNLARRKHGRQFLPRALSGLAAFRRLYGELERAKSSYLEALALAGELDDREQILWGLAQVMRLLGQNSKALEYAIQAYRQRQSNWLKPSLAAIHLALDDLAQAKAWLAEIHTHSGITLGRARMFLAEIARRERQFDLAGAHLRAVDLSLPALREEIAGFPALLRLATAIGLELGASKAAPKRLQVVVSSSGPLVVTVNDRSIDLSPESRAAEVLVFLLEQGHSLTTHELVTAFWPDLPDHLRRRRAQTVSAHIRQLRKSLGWEGSVVTKGSTHQLDPNADWHYSKAASRADKNQGPQRFMTGGKSDWVQATENQLNTALDEGEDWLN
jgi:tetratricopeptide (TPR) repeat protein